MEDGESLLGRILDGAEDPTDLPITLLQNITNNFSKERNIGKGGFGAVYKGVLGERNVAVKRIYVNLEKIDDDDKQFGREINCLWNTNHPNVVRFLGFCSNIHHKRIPKDGSRETIMADVRQRLFCFEYISNGSLDKHITGYWAPENMESSKTIPACDIYSLGAIIMELVTGVREVPDKHNVLRRWRHRWNNPPTPLQYQQVTGCIDVAVRCREEKPEARPSIKETIDFLNASTNGHTAQEISTYLDDDMLGIEPLELCFTFKLNKDDDMLGIVNLSNKTKTCFAFNIEIPSKQRYTIRPDKGIVPPGCNKYPVQITVQPVETLPLVTHNADKFIVRSTKVSEGLGITEITAGMFHPEAGKVVDEVDLMVLYGPVSLKTGRDLHVPVEVVSHKAIKSSSYKLDRRNFHPPEKFSHRQPTNMTYLLRASDRAMDVTRGAMGSLLHKLGELYEEFNLETSVKKDVDELVKMQQVLCKVSDVQQDNLDDLVNRWASNVREMSYDLEDFVDGFLVHTEPDSDGSGFRDLTHEMCFLLEKGKSHQPIGDLIKHHISKQVQDEAQQHKACNMDNVVANATTKVDIKDRRVSALYEDKELLVGIETPRDELIRLLKEDGNVPKEKLRVVSIVGMGGLGKTTLANEAYKNLKAQYDHKTLVSVGQNPDVQKVLTKIIRKLNKNFRKENLDVEELVEELRAFLEDKRYFIVIDDIWDSEAWGDIGSAFPRNNHGSRVITTTRIEDVARACCGDQRKNVYWMKPLSEENSRSLFLRKIFGPVEDCPDAQKDISTDILKKCGGMPLAINSIVSLLADQQRSTWDSLRNTLGAMVEENPQMGNMKEILDLSYIHLPDHLKACLLYICKYREDEEIDKKDLLRQWVAEGFVVSKNGRVDAEDVAENYFKALINMCMIEPGKKDYNDEVLSFKVHDIMLELIRSKAAEENFIHVIDGSKVETGARGKIRRVSVHCNGEDDSRIVATMKGCSHVRSVFITRGSLVSYFLEFKYVRVLHLFQEIQGYPRDKLDFTGIGRLFFLRYFKFEGCDSSLRLPDQIGELQQLETIDIRDAWRENCPSDIVSLPWLSHLNLGKPAIVLPNGIGRMKSLRIKGLGELTNLRKLKFSLRSWSIKAEKVSMDALHSSICKLSASLRTLSYADTRASYEDSPSWISSTPFPQGSHSIRELNLWGCEFQSCPQWIGQLRGLCSLRIMVREVADGVSIVAGFPSLAHFDLSTFRVEEKEESVVIPGTVLLSPVEGNSKTTTAFQALKHLIFNCPKASLTFEKGAMPKLEKLDVLFYKMTPQLLPVGIQHLPAPTLQDISLSVWKNSKRQHEAYVRDLLEGAFKPHHPGADILIYV